MQQSLLYDLRDQLTFLLSDHLGVHRKGLSQLAREAKTRGAIDKVLANKIVKIDFSYNLVRHLDPPSLQKFITDFKQQLSLNSHAKSRCEEAGVHIKSEVTQLPAQTQLY